MKIKVYEIITNKILEKLEKGTVPWHKPWVGGDRPMNLITKKPYRGINTFMLSMSDYKSPYWATYKQIVQLGGQVNKGEKGTPVIFWKFMDKEIEEDDGSISMAHFPLMRYYTVFNLDQTTGLESHIPETKKLGKNDAIKACENVVNHMPKRPEIVFDKQRACYHPKEDYVNMPKMETFDNSEAYYSTLFHELTHSTGHEKRLKRNLNNFHGDELYSKEELIAEMGAAFLCGHCQIENKLIDNSASYIQSWLEALKNDKQMVIQAGGQAQKAADFILNQLYKEKKRKEKK